MRMKGRCGLEKYFRGRVNRIWQPVDGKEEEDIKGQSELSNFRGSGDVNAINPGQGKKKKKQEEELSHGKDE